MGGAVGPAAVPARGRRLAADVGLLGGEQGGVRDLRPTRRRWSRGCRSTRPSSTSAGCGGSRGRRSTSPCGCAARSSSRSACPSPSAWRGRSSWPRWRARVAKPDGLLVVPPARRARLPAPAAGRAAVGRRPRHGRQAARPRDHHRRRGRPAARARARRDARPGGRAAPPRPRPQPRSPAGAGGRPPPRRWARSTRSAAGHAPRGRSTPSSSGWSTASPAGCAPPTACAARSCCGCASATSRARPGRTRCPMRPRSTQTILATGARAARDRHADHRAQGLTLLGITLGNLERRQRGPARLPFDRRATGPRRGARRRPRPLRHRPPSPGRCCSVASGPAGAAAPRPDGVAIRPGG